MEVAILARKPLPLHEWTCDQHARLHILAPERLREYFSPAARYYASQAFFLEFGDTEAIARACETLPQLDILWAPSELDVLRAASLRERLGVPGQNLGSALSFRDKPTMKRHLSKAGIPNPPHALVINFQDVNAFYREHGTCLLKPRTGAGSRQIAYIADERDIEAVQSIFEISWPKHYWMVEKYLPGRQFHVDGLFFGGEIIFSSLSEYLAPSMMYSQGVLGGSFERDHKELFATKLKRYALATLRALPTPSPSAFHLDIYLDDSGKPHLGEVACRAAGNRILDVIAHGWGIDLNEQLFRMLTGGAARVAITRSARYFGWAAVRRKSVPFEEPRSPPFPWISGWRFHGAPRGNDAASVSAVDNVTSFLAGGSSPAEVKNRLMEAGVWSESQLYPRATTRCSP